MSARVMGWAPGAGRIDAPLGALVRLGATPENDVVMRVDGVSRSHARIVSEQDAFFVEDANSRNGTWLNGQRIKRARLRHLDVITLGRYAELVFVERAGGAQPAVAARMRVRLEWTDGDRRGSVTDLPAGETLIGRADACAIVLDTPAVSRAHARISNVGGRVVIEDLGSANGTTVDGQQVRGPMALATGAEVVLGGVHRFRVLIDGAASSQAADTQIGVTPAAAQDMEWATRLVFSATDLEAVAHAAGHIERSSPPAAVPVAPPTVRPTSASAPAAAAPAQGTRIGGSDLRVPPGLGPAPSAPAKTQFDVRAPLAAPDFARPAEDKGATRLGADRTRIDGAAAPISGNNLPPGIRPPTRTAQATIASVRLSGEAGVFTVTSGTSTVGRSADATIRIDNKQLSRVHAAITVAEREVTVEDRGSVNGTSVNGTAITAPTRLTSGDRLAFANVEFVVALTWTEGT